MRLRIALGALGLAIGTYGVFLLLSRQDRDQVLNAAVWLASGVVLHDFVLAPLVLLLVFVGAWIAPVAVRAPAASALVVLGSVTLLAIPVLGRFGARPDNPTLLDRDYVVGWLVLAGAVVLVTVVMCLVRSRRQVRR